MKQQYQHKPVLGQAVQQSLSIKPNGVYIDGTFGRGGHAKMILDCLSEHGRLLVMDKDPQALQVAEQLAAVDHRVTVIPGCFSTLRDAILAFSLNGKIDGVLVDIGVSSPQLDDPERGFSFQHDGPLDMRMSQQGQGAADWLNSASEQEIAQVIKTFGEEPFAKRIAREIIKHREVKPLSRTKELVDIVKECVPQRVQIKQKKHVATKTFQAIRMHINQELSVLNTFLSSVPMMLAPKGRLAVITFHSLEDRVVKAHFQGLVKVNIPKQIPIRDSEMVAPFAWALKKAVAGEDELLSNYRARSAKLRVIEKQDTQRKGNPYVSSTKTYIA